MSGNEEKKAKQLRVAANTRGARHQELRTEKAKELEERKKRTKEVYKKLGPPPVLKNTKLERALQWENSSLTKERKNKMEEDRRRERRRERKKKFPQVRIEIDGGRKRRKTARRRGKRKTVRRRGKTARRRGKTARRGKRKTRRKK